MKQYIAGWNIPGCLPELDIATFDTFEEARDFIVQELRNYADELRASCDVNRVSSAGWHSLAKACRGAAERASKQTDSFTLEVPGDRYVYWVMQHLEDEPSVA
jgi:hypothetical protein